MKAKHGKEASELHEQPPAAAGEGAAAAPAPDAAGTGPAPESGAAAPAAAIPPAAPAPEPAKPGEVDALRDRLLRLQADFDNFRKRTQRDRNDLAKRVHEELMAEIIPVLDHLDLAVEAACQHEALEPYVEGFKLVSGQLLSVLAKFGLVPLDAATVFDVAQHEAISHLPSETVPENGIISQVRKGYRLGERLLRPAQMVVSSGPVPRMTEAAAAPADEAPAAET